MFYFSKQINRIKLMNLFFVHYGVFNTLLRQNIIYFVNNNILMGLLGFTKISLTISKIPINMTPIGDPARNQIFQKFAEQLVLVERIYVKFQINIFRGTRIKNRGGIPPPAGVEGSENGPGVVGLMNLYIYK